MSATGAAILADVSDDAPAGENMEFDPDFGALDRACQGKPETQYGDTITAAIPPEWKEALALGESLLQRTRDLRILALLAMARLNQSGLLAFAETVGQIRHQVEQRWDVVHPQLDPEDDNDPTLRANALFRLQDPAYILRPLRDLPLATSAMTGPIKWRDIALFEGTLEPEAGQEKPTEAFIRGGFSKTDPQRLNALREAVDQLIGDVAAIPAAFDERSGYGTGPDLTNLSKLLIDIQQKLRRFEPRADATETEPGSDPAPTGEEAGSFDAARAPTRGGANIRSMTAVASRDDALYLLELASSYFRTMEPSSPLPLLIDRAVRLAAMNFMDILREMAPDGLVQAQTVAGAPAE